MPDDDLVRLDLDGDPDAPRGTVATLRVDRPPMNALNAAVQAELAAHATDFSRVAALDAELRDVVAEREAAEEAWLSLAD